MTFFNHSRLLQAGSTFAATLLLAGTAAPLQAAPAASVAANTTAATKVAAADTRTQARDDRRLCVDAELTGSRLPRRVCRTAVDWESLHGGVPTY